MSDIQDPYKSMGIITLKIENLSQFPISGPDSCRCSDVVYIRGLPWKFWAFRKDEDNDDNDDDVESPTEKCICCLLECNKENTDSDWSCRWVAIHEYRYFYMETQCLIMSAKQKYFGIEKTSIENLMDPLHCDYDKDTDSFTFHVHVIAEEPRGLQKVPDVVYKKYSIRSEHALCVEFKDNSNCYTSSIWIEDKLCSLTYSPEDKNLNLEMVMHSSDTSKTVAECVFWFWNGKEIVILKKTFHAFSAGTCKICVDTTDNLLPVSEFMANFPKINVGIPKRVEILRSKFGAEPSNSSFVPANKKFNVVIRLLDKRIESENNVESYYGDYDCDLEKITLIIAGAEKASFTVPKVDLFRASPVFRRMFTVEMKEKATGKVEEIPDSNPQEFGDFLKAISPDRNIQIQTVSSNVLGLLKLAHLYECQTLLDRCESHLMNCVEIPLWELLTFADLYGLNKLQNLLMMSLDESMPALLIWYKESKPYTDWMHMFSEMNP